jgi:DNA-binding NarL/FixJ family response regulator
MNINLKIAIAEVSPIVRSGVEVQLKKLQGFHFHFLEIVKTDGLVDALRIHKPDILIVNPSMAAVLSLQQLKEECGCPQMKCLALLYNLTDKTTLRPFDDKLSIFDSSDEIRQKLEQLFAVEIQEDTTETGEQQILSMREKEIVVCVVKGMTNHLIAERLFLSTHTVITHRRNIARKLQIHSASGLTVYAIVNKLVELSEVGKL